MIHLNLESVIHATTWRTDLGGVGKVHGKGRTKETSQDTITFVQVLA